jgi:hypothetical protein
MPSNLMTLIVVVAMNIQSLKRARRTKLLFGIIMLSLMALKHGHGADLDAQGKALDIISKFANDICTKVPLEGHGTEIKLSGQAKAELNSILKRIADLGIEGSGDYKDAEYQGVLQNELAESLKNADTCRFNLFKELKDKLIPSMDQPAPQPSIPTPETVDVLYEAVSVHLPHNTGYILDTAKFFEMAAEAFKTVC